MSVMTVFHLQGSAKQTAGLPMKEKAIQEKALLKEVPARKQEETKCEMAENKGKSKHSTCTKVPLCRVNFCIIVVIYESVSYTHLTLPTNREV